MGFGNFTYESSILNNTCAKKALVIDIVDCDVLKYVMVCLTMDMPSEFHQLRAYNNPR